MIARILLRLAPVPALVATACATGIPTDTRPRDSRLPRIAAPSRSSLAPAGGIADGRAEIRLDAGATWLALPADSALAVTIGATYARNRDSWGGIRASARWSGGTTIRPFAEIAAGAGTGLGAGRSLEALLGAAAGHLRLSFRAVRFTEVRDSGAAGFLPGPDPAADSGDRWRDHADTELTTLFSAGRFSFDVLGGLRLDESGSGATWANARVATRIGTRFELSVKGGRRPDRPERGEPGGAFWQLGVALRSPAPPPAALPPSKPPDPATRLRAQPLDDGAWSLTIRIPAATSVEINGDVTGWSPVALLPSPADQALWSARLVAADGVYLVSLRVDGGAWRPPPGLPVVPDGFGGQAGLLEINRNHLNR